LQAGATPKKLVDGPFVLTDADVGQDQLGDGWGGEAELTLETSAAACAGNGTVFAQVGQVFQSSEYGTTIHGGRYLVPAGSMLCAKGNVIWAGFRPYQ
jgi:hypothetical protein